MNVQQLIESLQSFPGNADVFFYEGYNQQTFYAESVYNGGQEDNEEVPAVYVILA